jgi:hypothetical protein
MRYVDGLVSTKWHLMAKLSTTLCVQIQIIPKII